MIKVKRGFSGVGLAALVFVAWASLSAGLVGCKKGNGSGGAELEAAFEGENMIPNGAFNADLESHYLYKEGGSADLVWNADKKCMEVKIHKIGSKAHSVQTYVDGFSLNRGVKYGFCFDAWSSIDREIDWRFQINGGDYHSYADGHFKVGRSVSRCKVEFTMEESNDPAPRLCFNMGYVDAYKDAGVDGATIGEHSVYIDNVVLVVLDDSGATGADAAIELPNIRVNQLGYKTGDMKYAVACDLDESDNSYSIVDVVTEEVVKTGKIPALVYSSHTGEANAIIDFSDLKREGKYKFVTASGKESYEFEIGSKVYEKNYAKLVQMLFFQRCGMKLTVNNAGIFEHPACHTQLATVYGTNEKLDVSGGWHDAGDYGRYIVSGAKAVADLFVAYEKSGNAALLDEAKYEIDWMLKMQDEKTGGVYHKVTGELFPGTVMPQDETCELFLSPISNCATGDFAAILAKASVLYAGVNGAALGASATASSASTSASGANATVTADFASRCLLAAEKANEYLIAHKDDAGFKNPKEIVTGEYPDENCNDEIFWSAVELYNATGNEKYFAQMESVFEKLTNVTELGWADMSGYGSYDAITSKKLLAKHSDFVSKVKNAFIAKANEMIEVAKKNPYRIARDTNYEWGSNMGIAGSGVIFMMANSISPNAKYVEYAKYSMNYLYGVNATGYCFITKTGTLTPTHTHHRPSQNLGRTMAGMLVGGVNSNLEDPYAQAVLKELPPAKCYVDNEQSYSCNEICVYWNSPLIVLMDYLK